MLSLCNTFILRIYYNQKFFIKKIYFLIQGVSISSIRYPGRISTLIIPDLELKTLQ